MAHHQTLNTLQALQTQSLTIIKLAEPVLSSSAQHASSIKRESDISSSNATENPTAASLAADLAHYKELFSKLRFSYLEQVTKEKFLRAVVGDPPLIVEHADNIRLERELGVSKAGLKAQKEEVGAMVLELEAIGRDLSLRYETVQLQTRQLSSLPDEIEVLEAAIARLRQQQKSGGETDDGTQNLPLPATLALLNDKNVEAEALDAQIRALQTAIPKKTRELERLHTELRPLEMQKQEAIGLARDAIHRKEQGEHGVGDDLELKGRWYSGAEVLMSNVFGVKT